MKMNEGDRLHGFLVERVREITELEGTLYEMKHQKSGAELVWLSNGEENKLFSVAFKTIPTDDTGVFHILEHSVLCGSEKYTVKEPFVELLKGSLQTFLNAMTFPDKTVYPVASRDEKDFQNLMKVYLDAVFAPAIYQNPNIFYQEGWHYELTDENAVPEYKGVVFNEMKGAFSSVDQLLMSGLKSMLFPDNCYGKESGGNPTYIPDLSYEQFLDAHRKYYAPSNARIYLDGNLDIETALEIMDTQYLDKLSKSASDPTIALQEPVCAQEKKGYYEIADSEDETNKTQMAFGSLIGTWKDRKRILATQILGDYLAGSNDAPLKKKLLSSGLLQDMYIQVFDGIQQPFVFTQIRNMNYEKKEQIQQLIKKTLEEIIEQGLDNEELEAIMNQTEFQMRESSEPKGLNRNFNALNAWMFGGDPLTYMTVNEVFCDLREELGKDYFVKILKEVFLEEAYTATYLAVPSKNIGKEKREKEHTKLTEQKERWSKEELNQVIELNRELNQWQQTTDQEYDIATLPKLNLSDVNENAEQRITNQSQWNGVTILTHPSKVNGIIYLNMYFNVGNIPEEMLPELGLLPNLLGNLPTENYSVAKLQQAIKRDIGMMNFDVKTYSVPGKTKECKVMLWAGCSVVEEKLVSAQKLLVEILLHTDWQAVDKIQEILTQCDQMFQQSLIMNGHSYAMKRAASKFSAESYVKEQMEGYSCYQWLHKILSNEENKVQDYAVRMDKLLKQTIDQSNMFLSVTATEKIVNLNDWIQMFPEGKAQEQCWTRLPKDVDKNRKEAIVIPAGISYAVMGLNLNSLGQEYTGEWRVVAKLLSLSYLWNEVRVQGGAYGAGFTVSETGNAFYYSYRDPNVFRSLNIYREAADYLREFCESKEELDKYIIGSIADLEPLLSTREWAISCDNDYFRGITMENRSEEKSRMLHSTKERLLQFCETLEKIAQNGGICVIGHEQAIADCKTEELNSMSL